MHVLEMHYYLVLLLRRIKQCEIYPEELCEFVSRVVSSEKALNILTDEVWSSCRPCFAFSRLVGKHHWASSLIVNSTSAVRDVTHELNSIMALEKTVHTSPHEE